MNSKKSKKKYIDELYDSKHEGVFYSGDGTSHRSKKDVVIKKWHVVTGCVVLFAVLWAVFFLVDPANKNKDKWTPPDFSSETSSAAETVEDGTIVQNEIKSPWFSVTSAGVLYFHPEEFEGSHLIIPKRFNGEAVERLNGESFSVENDTVSRLTIHEGIQVIGEDAFKNFTKLSKVDFASTVQRVGAGSFKETPWYKNNTAEFLVVGKGVLIKYEGNDDVVAIPDNVTAIDCGVFEGVECKTVVIPEQTTYIGAGAFKDCAAEKVVIPDSLQLVESDSFVGCKWLEEADDEFVVEGAGILLKCNTKDTTIRIPDDVITISGFDPGEKGKDINLILGAKVSRIADLEALGNVKAFKVSERNTTLSAKSGVLYSFDGSTLYRYPVYKEGSVFYTKSDTLKIGNNAFSGAQLERVELYDGLLVIGNSAFRNCKKLKQITIPDTVTELGSFAFRGCDSLQEATVSESVKALPIGTFMDCKKLSSVGLSEGMGVISALNFKGCEELKYFYVTKNLQRIHPQAFDQKVEFDVDGANKYYMAKNGNLERLETDNGNQELVGNEAEKDPF